MLQRTAVALAALLLVGCEGADVADPPALQSGPASNTLFTPGEDGMDAAAVAQAVCNKLIGCVGAELKLTSCVRQIAPYTSFVIDAQGFIACFNGISCGTLLQSQKLGDTITGCLDLDPASAACNGGSVHYCNRQGACKDVACTDLCKLFDENATGGSCVMEDDGPDCNCGGLDYTNQPGG